MLRLMARRMAIISSSAIFVCLMRWGLKRSRPGFGSLTTLSISIEIHPRWRSRLIMVLTEKEVRGVVLMVSAVGRATVVAKQEVSPVGINIGDNHCVRHLISFAMMLR